MMGEIYRHNTESLATWLLRIFRGGRLVMFNHCRHLPQSSRYWQNLEHHLPDWYSDLSSSLGRYHPGFLRLLVYLELYDNPSFEAFSRAVLMLNVATLFLILAKA
ncbi:uncharacterized protein TrAtP1_011112 [Trichoderma atroviride]|uniref:uncharacterized protein n=1 Tax=Hypocrea atroviridis TaxID=63577 RepID=UPI0033220DC3|nr:hypothetical protein TrAtP1_011112 [Trichoderma atroviride]